VINKDLTFLILSVTLIIGSFIYTFSEIESSYLAREEVIFIEDDLTKVELIEKLNEKGLIKNKRTYYFSLLSAKVSEILNGAQNIAAGGYAFSNKLTATAIDSAVDSPEYKYVAVVEGWRKEEIAENIGAVMDWEDDKVEKFKGRYPLCSFVGREGYMAPGEYLIKSDANIQDIKEKMENQFIDKISELSSSYPEYSDDELNEIITIASLIQRESGGKSDMRLISGVIQNRLKLGMPLQIDATLQYAKGDDGLWWPRVRSEDKYLDSPFNTYKNSGLPPQPIANPGRAALEAAMNPLTTECLFYLHDKSGNIHCSADYDGHLSNIKSYLK
jgi:UPF0755 protein